METEWLREFQHALKSRLALQKLIISTCVEGRCFWWSMMLSALLGLKTFGAAAFRPPLPEPSSGAAHKHKDLFQIGVPKFPKL